MIGFLFFAFILAAAVLLALKFEVKNNLSIYVLTLPFMGLIIYPFIIPIIRTYKRLKFQLSQVFKNRDLIHTKCIITIAKFDYQNEFFSYSSSWNNVKNSYIEDGHIKFETIIPEIKFSLPLDKFEFEALDLIKEELSISNLKKE